MSNAALKAAVTGTDVTKSNGKPTTLIELLSSDKTKHQLAAALPKHMTADRMARVIMTELRKVPKLAACDPHSFMGAVMMASQVGLEPGGALGHCYLIPFENRRANRVEVQFIMGYRGMLDLARRSGQIVSIEARAVYDSDKFHVSFGLDPDLKHEPAWELADRGELRAVYAVAKLKDGGVQFEVLTRHEIEGIRNESQGYKTAKRYDRVDTPWIAHFEEMAKKTVIRRLFKYLPVSIELQRAVGLDEQGEAGIAQDNGAVIDGVFSHAEEGEPVQQTAAADQQDAALRNVEQQASKQPVIDFAQVKAKLENAGDLDLLDAEADLIQYVDDAQRRDELGRIYKKRRDELVG